MNINEIIEQYAPSKLRIDLNCYNKPLNLHHFSKIVTIWIPNTRSKKPHAIIRMYTRNNRKYVKWLCEHYRIDKNGKIIEHWVDDVEGIKVLISIKFSNEKSCRKQNEVRYVFAYLK